MHPCLSEWPSDMFYEGTLQNGITEGERAMTQVTTYTYLSYSIEYSMHTYDRNMLMHLYVYTGMKASGWRGC
jgi:hypothetical protein